MYFVGRELKKTHNLIARVIEDTQKPQTKRGCCVSFMTRKIIDFLYRNQSKQVFQRDIEKEFSLRRSSASQLLSKMEEGGYIVRLTSQKDKRLKAIVLTDKAEKKCADFKKGITRFEESLIDGLSSEEVEAFLKTLYKIQDNVQKLTNKSVNSKNECETQIKNQAKNQDKSNKRGCKTV